MGLSLATRCEPLTAEHWLHCVVAPLCRRRSPSQVQSVVTERSPPPPGRVSADGCDGCGAEHCETERDWRECGVAACHLL